MTRSRAIKSALLSCLVAGALPTLCLAQQNPDDALPMLQVGPVIVNPSLVLTETYTDNVFATAEDTEDDFITSIAPGLLLRFPFRTHQLSLDAGLDVKKYADFGSEDATDWRVAGLGEFNIGDRWSVKLGDTYLRRQESAFESSTGRPEDVKSNVAGVAVKYALANLTQLEVDYSNTALRYSDAEDFRSRDENLVSVYLRYRFLTATSAFVQYEFKDVAFEDATGLDNVVHSGFAGLTWDLSANTQGTAKVGYLAKNYDEAGVEDFDTLAGGVELRHALADRASVSLSARREVNESKYAGTRYYTSTGVFAALTYRFLDRLSATASAGYGVDEFSDRAPGQAEAREDKTANAGVGVLYSFNSWLDVALRYRYTNRDSNIDSLSATENAVSFEIAAHR